MTQFRSRRLLCLLIVFLMAPIAVTPQTQAWHLTETPEIPEDPPKVPDDSWQDTGMVFVDRPVHDAQDQVRQANDDANATYRIIRGPATSAVANASHDVPRQPLEILRDGAGGRSPPDARDALRGGFGDWQVLGDSAWDDRPHAARTGQSGYTQATEPGGVYRGGALSLLVSPEIDLDTKLLYDERSGYEARQEYDPLRDDVNDELDDLPAAPAPVGRQSLPPFPTPSEFSAVYSLLQTACDTVNLLISLDSSTCEAYRLMLAGDPVYSFRYTLRHNMATTQGGTLGVDGVTVLVFDEKPPDFVTAAMDCALTPPQLVELVVGAKHCIVATPAGGYPVEEIESMPKVQYPDTTIYSFFAGTDVVHYPGYSGSSGGWVTDTIDLAPWEGRSVWLGFLFSSGNIPPVNYFESNRFDQQAGHYGFEMDDLRVQAPAAAHNLKVRTPTEPSFVPRIARYEEAGIPVISPGEPFEAGGEVANMGIAPMNVTATLRILNKSAGELSQVVNASGVPYELRVDDVRLGPADILELAPVFEGLPTGVEYVVQVCAHRLGDGPTSGDIGFCDRGPAGLPPENACSEDPVDADVCDEVALHAFHVTYVNEIEVSPVFRQADRLQAGDSTVMSVTIRNRGNVEQTLNATARIVDVTGEVPNDQDQHQEMLWLADGSQAQLLPRTFTLEPGDETELSWEVTAKRSGQYRLRVDVVGHGNEPPPLDPVRDLFPQALQAWRSLRIPDAGIQIDGAVVDPTWFQPNQDGVVDGSTRFRVRNSGDALFLAIHNTTAERLEIRFADHHETGQLRAGYENGYIVDASGIRALRFDNVSLQWQEATAVQSPADGGRGPTPADGTRFDFELKVPIGVDADQHGLTAKPGDAVPFILRLCDGEAKFCQHFPLHAPLNDGDGFLAADDSLDDEVAQWHTMVLSDAATGVSPVFLRRMSAGFGVDSTPPPYLAADFAASCPSFLGWATNVLVSGDARDEWNCGGYADAGNQTTLYRGMSPESDCGGTCLPYATLGGVGTMYTPPFDLPVDAGEPTLLLSHQYSTPLVIDDYRGRIIHQAMPKVYLEVWNQDTGSFDEAGMLEPTGGFPTEADAGTEDPRFARQFQAPADFWLDPTTEASGWWWPQGRQPFYQPPDKPLNTGGSFVGGSPWTTEALPLTGTSLEVAGATVRLRFDHIFHATPDLHDVQMSRAEVPFVGFLKGGESVERYGFRDQRDEPAYTIASHRPFAAVCILEEAQDVYILASSPCGTAADENDIRLSGSSKWDRVGSPGGPTRSPPPGTVFDWIERHNDGRYTDRDSLYLNVGGSDARQAEDVRIAGPGAAVGSTYCGTTRCAPDAATARATDIVFVDHDRNDRWSPEVVPGTNNGKDVAFLPSRVLNGEGFPSSRELDWGWRIGGLAVMEGSRFVRDVSVTDAQLDIAWDPARLGLGPGTSVPVKVTVGNDGHQSTPVVVQVVGEDVDSGAETCSGASDRLQVPDGTERDVAVDCVIADTVTGGRVMLRAEVHVDGTAQEAFLANNLQRVRGFYPVRSMPDAAVTVDALPAVEAVDKPRQLAIRVQNVGNVPLADVVVHLQIQRMTEDGPVHVIDPTTNWTLDAQQGIALPLGGDVFLSHRNTDAENVAEMTFTPKDPGAYRIKVRVATPGDSDVDNNEVVGAAKALATLYENDLDSTLATALPGVVEGTLRVDDETWSLQGNSHDGSVRLIAGDLARGEIDAGTDASVYLPTIDLGRVKEATLSFKHRYDLEEHFDAGRVEVSTDGGTTWSPMVPNSQPSLGLPDGYPSTQVLGANAILGEEFECFACAYTGRSGDLPEHQDGWVAAEFDLATQSQFFVPSTVAEFPLHGLASQPAAQPLIRNRTGGDADVQFTHLQTFSQASDAGTLDEADINTATPNAPHWGVDAFNWFEDEQYWWIDNLTYSQPAPRFGQTMWWSGTAGEAMAGQTMPKVGTTLTLALDSSHWTGLDVENDTVVLSWWDWRAGWRDGDDRAGTGGLFEVEGPGGTEVEIRERLDSGWTRRELTVPTDGGEVVFTYKSGSADDVPTVSEQEVPISQFESNLGWFIEGVESLAYDGDGNVRPVEAFPLDGLTINETTGKAGAWIPAGISGHAAIEWSLVERGAAARDGGWHIETLELPGLGFTPAWWFASDDPEGYPANANSRLVTPRVDLRDYAGETASIRFDHKYGFNGVDEDYGGTENWHSRAVDAGTVVFQTYDADSGMYGAWLPLGARPHQDVSFEPPSFQNGAERFMAAPAWFDAFGYPGVALMPPSETPLRTSSPGPDRGFSAGLGHDLLTSTGYMRPILERAGLHVPNTEPWQPYPFAYVFTGNSGRGASSDAEGWSSVAWDISSLIGQEVRFGFQAWTNPSDHPCNTPGSGGTSPASLTEYNLPGACAGQEPPGGNAGREEMRRPRPEFGWAVANVEVVGETFRGGPADIRFRLATDGSFTNGEWSLDDITVTGTRYKRNVLIETPETDLLAQPGTTLVINATIDNQGTQERADLALVSTAVVVENEDMVTKRLIGVNLPNVDPVALPPGVTDAVGPFVLAPGGLDGDSLPFRMALDLPDFESHVEVRLQLLERLCDACDYTFVRNEAGASQALWNVTVENRLEVALVPPFEGRSAPLEVSPTRPRADQEVTFAASVANVGVREATIDATWTVDEIVRKGAPDESQRGVAPEETVRIGVWQESARTLPRGQQIDLTQTVVPPRDGLYRVRLDVDPGDGPDVTQSREFLVGDPVPYYRTDFAQGNSGWIDVSAGVEESGTRGEGGSPEEIQFRRVGDQWLWGVSHEQFNAGRTYCSFGGCNHARTSSPVSGLRGVAENDVLVDLGRVPNDRAVLTLRHGHWFEDPGDGGRLEVRPLRTPVPEVGGAPAAFHCTDGSGNRQDLWFALQPTDSSAQQADILSMDGWREAVRRPPPSPPWDIGARVNPINEQEAVTTSTSTTSPVESEIPAFGGPARNSHIVRYFMDQEPVPFCPPGWTPEEPQDGTPFPTTLVNYTMQLRLHTGTLPGLTWPCDRAPKGVQSESNYCDENGPEGDGKGRPGAKGWQIDSISVTSVEAAVAPERRDLPVQYGYPKQFSFQVTNNGSVPEGFRVVVDEALSTQVQGFNLSSWFEFPQEEVLLAPGETTPFFFDVTIPQDPAPDPATYLAVLHMTAASDPNVRDTIALNLVLKDKPLPNLVVTQLTADDPAPVPRLQQDTLVTLTTTVVNQGRRASDPAVLLLDVERAGQQSPVTQTVIGRLCPADDTTCAADGDPQRASVSFEWQVPHEVGEYSIRARLDPEGRLVETSTADNNVTLRVHVVPLEAPDAAVTDLEFEGVEDDGYAIEGRLVRMTANVTNTGVAPATQLQVRILSGTAELLRTTLDSLAPGETRQVTAARLVSRGETLVRAVVIVPSGDDVDPDNNEMSRILRTRGIDLALEPLVDGPVTLAPGETATLRVNVTNRGNALERAVLSLDPSHPGWGLRASPNPVTVAADATAWTLVSLQAPENVTAGIHNLTLRAGPQSQPNVHAVAVLQVHTPASTDAPEILLPANLSVERLHVHVASHRNAPETLRLTLVEPADWTLTETTLRLPARANTTVNLDLTVPAAAPPGPTSVVIQAHDLDGVLRTEATGLVDVAPHVDGTAHWLNGSWVPDADDPSVRVYDYVANVTNQGNVPFQPSLAATALPEASRQLDVGSTPTILPGASHPVALRVQTATERVEEVHGRAQIWAHTDNATPPAMLAELDIPSLTMPDLVVDRLRTSPSGGVRVHEPVRVFATVSNQGLVPAPATRLFGFVDGDLVDTHDVPGLDPGNEVQVNMTWAFQAPGAHLVGVRSNGDARVEEVYVDNNGQNLVLDVTQTEADRWADRAADVPGPALPLLLLLFAIAAAATRRREGPHR